MIEKLKANLHVVIIFLVAAYLRILYIFVLNPTEKYIFSDMKMYFSRSQEILTGAWDLQHFFQPIGFTATLAWLFANFSDGFLAVKLMHLILSLFTLALIYLAAKNYFGKSIAIPALIFSSFHFPFIMYSGVLLAETGFTFLISLFIYLLSRKVFPWSPLYSGLLGLVFLFSFLTKGTFAFFPILLGAWALFVFKKEARRQATLSLVAFALIVSCGLILHGLWTEKTIGVFQLSASSGGLNLVEGKCPSKYNSAAGYYWHSPLFVQTHETQKKEWNEPFTNSSYYTQQGLQCMFENPMVLVESLRYIPYLFINNELWPSLKLNPAHKMLSRNYNLFFGLLMWPAILIALLLLIQNPKDQKFVGLVLPVLSIFLTVWIFKSELRFRIPLDVVFIPIAVYGWSFILEKIFPNLNEEKRAHWLGGSFWLVGAWLLLSL